MVGRHYFLLLAMAGQAMAAGPPPAIIPSDPSTVIERLPKGYSGLDPVSTSIDLSQVNRMLDVALGGGDARLVSRARILLEKTPESSRSNAWLKARAHIAQYQHDFMLANQLLDAVLQADPRDAYARLSRAQLHIVRGELKQARSDCTSLAIGVDVRVGQACLAAFSLRMGEYGKATALGRDWLESAPDDDPLTRYMLTLLAESSSRAENPDVDALFLKALERNPDDVRTLSAYVRHLRKSGQQEKIMALLQYPPSEGLRLERALAAHALGSPAAANLTRQLRDQFRMAHRMGVGVELRDEAMFHLKLGGAPQRALALASKNFQTQRDYEDVAILVAAANAANSARELDAYLGWAKAQGLAAKKEAPP